MDRILITGGAGFAGSNLALRFREKYPTAKILCFDNLKRRGSELALSRLKARNIEFVHGDVRIKDDLLEIGKVDLIMDCAAEPSVLAGVGGSPSYVIETNLNGTINCLELARITKASVVFLSTSRVYPVEPINNLAYTETESRFSFAKNQSVVGASEFGIAEDFPTEGARSMYGASKLCSELLLHEYIDSYGINGVINRCGVLTGPWQMGKVDQGVIVLWVARHHFKKELSYIGYGGTGKQVRDILHIDDLFDLLSIQLDDLSGFNGEVFNVGGGNEVSVSLRELTALCQKHTGNEVSLSRESETRPNDLRGYISDCRKVTKRTGWTPKRGVDTIISEIAGWIRKEEDHLKSILT